MKLTLRLTLASTAAVLGLALAGCGGKMPGATSRPSDVTARASTGSAANNPADASLLAINLVKTTTGRKLNVTTTSFAPGGEIPYRYSDYGENISPALSWSNVPPEARSIVILMEDPDAKLPKPFIHWVMYNLPATVTELRRAVPPEMRLLQYQKTPQGANSRGSIGYFGPKPPYKDPAHHYHFQVFALDAMLDIPPGLDRQNLLRLMESHVLASGEVVGTYRAVKE